MVLAESSRDPDLSIFVGTAHLGGAVLLALPGERPVLGYLTEMEREEAAATGCRLLRPEALGVGTLRVAGADPVSFWAGIVEGALAEVGLEPQPLALAGRLGAGVVAGVAERLRQAGWGLLDGGEILRRWRRRKTGLELASIRRAAAGAAAGLRRIAELLAGCERRGDELWLRGERLRAAQLRDAVAHELAQRGLEQPQGSIVAAGRAGAVPHSQGDPERLLQAGESIVVDLFPRGELFADCTRTFCVGEAPSELRRAHAAVSEALARAARGAKDGVRGWDLQVLVCEELSRAGWPTPLDQPESRRGYVHNLGHGVGYELHEYPSFRAGDGEEGRLATGDVFTLEPGLYEPDEGWAVRLEDLYRLGTAGAENLTPLPYALDPRAYRSTQ